MGEAEYRNCSGALNLYCEMGGMYFPRQWKTTFDEALTFCENNFDCRGIVRGDGGYEPRKGPIIESNAMAHELWLCKGI